jgi:UDP-glucose 4-epimerase
LYNIASSVETSISELWELVASETGFVGAPVFAAERRGEVRRSVLKADRARRELGWEPRVQLVAGVQSAVKQRV